MKANIAIIENLCKKCGLCIHFCPQKVLVFDSNGYPSVAHPEKCTGCRLCFYRCPDFALEVESELDKKPVSLR
ncbi:MAG TPA: 2-ketoglutarate ferredoxin oxidoreductase subunit delta [Desulfotomaculum sp.]|nr:2-ketoglutarate ferredoxin oxidoreductase subunit delta [Desulfotomaculum sp.]